jgi:HD-GYP domain-containing protein (c-di-GMP phosphodiesterase class II)
MTKSWAVSGWCLVALLPTLLLALMLNHVVSDPVWGNLSFHVYIVSFAALLSLIMAVLMRLAAGQLRDPRVLFLSLAFMGIAGIFMTHGLTTPGELVPNNPWVGISSPFALFVGAFWLMLATIHWSPRVAEQIVNRQRLITVVFAGMLLAYGATAIGTSLAAGSPSSQGAASGSAESNEYGAASAATPESMSMTMPMPGMDMTASAPEVSTPFDGLFRFLEHPLVSDTLALLTLLMLTVVIVHYFRIYLASRNPLAAGFLFSGLFIAQSQIAMSTTTMMHLSWWEYHILVIAALSAAFAGLAREYANSGSLQGVVGGLLLRDTIVQLQRGYTDVIVALVEAVEAKDPYTRGHTQRVAELSVLIGQNLGLSPDQLRTLNQAAMLHDIGKISVPDSILNKPGKLTDAEFSIVKEHPVRGYRIIQNVRSLQPEFAGVLYHHERLDGSGYPDQLRGNAIPLDARIIAVADVFDALTSARPYRGPMTVDLAFEILDGEAGTKLDIECVSALRRLLPVWAAQAQLVSATGETASRPTVAAPESRTAVPVSLGD